MKKYIIFGLATAGYLYTEYKKLEIVYKQAKRLESLTEDHLTLDGAYTELLEKNKKLETFLNDNSISIESIDKLKTKGVV